MGLSHGAANTLHRCCGCGAERVAPDDRCAGEGEGFEGHPVLPGRLDRLIQGPWPLEQRVCATPASARPQPKGRLKVLFAAASVPTKLLNVRLFRAVYTLSDRHVFDRNEPLAELAQTLLLAFREHAPDLAVVLVLGPWIKANLKAFLP